MLILPLLPKKSSVIGLCNENKVSIDQMVRLCSKRSASRRWPLAVWGNILNIAAINTCVIYTKSTGIRLSRRKFILELIEQLRPKKQQSGSRQRKKYCKTECNNAITFTCPQCQNPTYGKCSQDKIRK